MNTTDRGFVEAGGAIATGLALIVIGFLLRRKRG